MSRPSSRYHHGDLATALVTAGLELARIGGPDALGLREVTRMVGVTPNAAYRHFADRQALVLAVAGRAQQQLATVMKERMAYTDDTVDPAQRARQRLRAVGIAYVEYAVSEPGWFQLAFLTHEQYAEDTNPAATGPSGAPPYQILLGALDNLVSAGVLPSHRRPHAEWACWSTVHGLAELATRGPLRSQPRTSVLELADYVVDRIISGIIGGEPPSATTKSPTAHM